MSSGRRFLRVVDRDPAMASRLANAVVDTYAESAKRKSTEDSANTLKFHADNAREYLKKLREVEDQLERYQREYELFTDLPSVKQRILERLLSLNMTLDTRSRDLKAAKERLAEVKKQLASTPETISAERSTEENPRYAELDASIASRKRLLDRMLLELTEEHHDVKRLRREIEDLQAELAETPKRREGTERVIANPEFIERKNEKAKLEQSIKEYEARLSSLASQIAVSEEELRGVSDREERHADLVRQKNEYERLYAEFRDRENKARTGLQLLDDTATTNIDVLAKAVKPERPYQAPKIKLALICVLAGLAAGVGLVCGLEVCDQSFRNKEDAAAFLAPVPVIGSITTIRAPDDVIALRKRRLLYSSLTILGVAALAATAVLFNNYDLLDWVKETVGIVIGIVRGAIG